MSPPTMKNLPCRIFSSVMPRAPERGSVPCCMIDSSGITETFGPRRFAPVWSAPWPLAHARW
jgi:hypothetical protein